MIVFPMAGLSKRFFNEGFKIPKYMLTAHGKTLFYWAIIGFQRYFKDQKFLFICRNQFETKQFLEENCTNLGIRNFQIVELDAETLGQAHTVSLGLNIAQIPINEPVTIFNIDTFRFGFEFPEIVEEPSIAGYLECFIGEGSNWSNVVTESNGSSRVIRTSEKKNESDLCCTGLYYFFSVGCFLNCYREYYSLTEKDQNAEHYIAPIYNSLISSGAVVKVQIIDRSSVIFCGTPSEYSEFKAAKFEPIN